MNDDAVFEAEIRSMLGRRDPASAPAHLADTVVERLRRNRKRSRLNARGRAVLNGVAGLAAVIVVAVFVLGRPAGPGSTPSIEPAPSSAPSLVAGDGLSAPAGLPLVQLALVSAALIGLGAVATRAKRRLVGYAAVAAMLGIVWIGSMIGTSDALAEGTGAFGVDPFRERPEGFSSGTFVQAEGDVEFRILAGIANTSRLPLDLVGIVPNVIDPESPERLPRIVGLGYLPDDDCCLPSRARPFGRIRLEPGESVQLVVLARAGRCATSAVQSGAMVIDSLPLVYEQLTLLHTTAVHLTEGVSIVSDGSC